MKVDLRKKWVVVVTLTPLTVKFSMEFRLFEKHAISLDYFRKKITI
jgi:hypothetical protein